MKMIMLLDLAQNRKLGLTEIAKNKENEIDENDKIKKRFSTIYIAKYGGKIKPNFDEVSEVRWVSPDYLKQWMKRPPQDFTRGFMRSFQILEDKGMA